MLLSATPVIAQPAFTLLMNDNGKTEAAARGVWSSRGYGWIASISERELTLYHPTDAGCLKDPATTEELQWLARYVAVDGTRMQIAAREKGATIYPFERIDKIPPECFESINPTNENVFNYFWSVMDLYYAFFDLHGVDWNQRRAKYASQVTEDMSEKALFELFSAMMEGLKDGHLELHAEIDGERQRFRASGTRVLRSALNTAFAKQKKIEDRGEFDTQWFFGSLDHMRKKALKRSAEKAAGGNIAWGKIGDIGYITVIGMGGFDDENEGFDYQIAAVHRIMNEVVADLADTKGLIFDVTLNQGGMDEISLALARHFTDKPVKAYTKVAHESGVEPQPFYVEPAASGLYLKPVTLVTSDVTVSAAEIFTMAMRALPTVTHKGDTTYGALSDILSKTLPNGWELEMSNEIYVDAEGILWEGTGIPPEEYIQIFDPQRMDRSRTDAIVRIAKEMQTKLK